MAIGIVDRVQPHVFAHIKTPAKYRISESWPNRVKLELKLNRKMAEKLENAPERKEKRDNSRYPFRAQLLVDLGKVSLTEEGGRMLHALQSNGEKDQAGRIVRDFIYGDRPAKVTFALTGTAFTNLCSCPKELKPELVLDGRKVALCDISYAHYCLLPVMLTRRIDHMREHGASESTVEPYLQELEFLIESLSEGDFYRKLCDDPDDDDEREKVKDQLLSLLNLKTATAVHIPLYRRLKEMFPLTFGILENLKSKDHRNAGKQLQPLTAEIINGVLLEMQSRGFPALPDTDCIICQSRHRKTACKLIGEAVYKLSGVRCRVGGERFKPSGRGGVK